MFSTLFRYFAYACSSRSQRYPNHTSPQGDARLGCAAGLCRPHDRQRLLNGREGEARESQERGRCCTAALRIAEDFTDPQRAAATLAQVFVAKRGVCRTASRAAKRAAA